MADSINKLPTDKSTINHDEIKIVDKIFKENENKISNIMNDFRDAILGAVLYIILSMPMVDSLLKSFIPIANNSPIFLMIFKAILFVFLFYFIRNFAFGRVK
mgnify:CR=1 FL=1|jgi:hypothetical protein